jgi:hypothetical protein
MVFFFSDYFFFAHVYKCFSKNTSAKGFSQNLHGSIFIYSSYFYASPSSPYYISSFLIALIAALKSSEAAFQFYPVF